MATKRHASRDAIPLVRAATEARVGYLVLRDWLLTGKVRGWQDGTRRWYVDRQDLRRYLRSRTETGTTAGAQPPETPPAPARGWLRLVGTFTVADFEDDRGPATLERVGRLAVTPTGEPFREAETGEPTIEVVTLTDRVAAIAFLASFLPSIEIDDDPLVLYARDLFERLALWTVLYELAGGDSTAGGAVGQPRERPLTTRERMVAMALVNSFRASITDTGPPGTSGATN